MTRKVGYGSPPDHTKWQKGRSGNPSGRPKGRVNFVTDLVAELSETIQITEGGKSRRITKQRALQKSLATKGMKGDVRAAQIILTWAAAIREEPVGQALPPLEREDIKLLQGYLTQLGTSGEANDEL